MFSTLVESSTVRAPRHGAMALSIIAHSAIILGATAATMHATSGTVTRVDPINVVPLSPPVALQRRTATTSTGTIASAACRPIDVHQVEIGPIPPVGTLLRPIGAPAPPTFSGDSVSLGSATVGVDLPVSGSVFDVSRVDKVAALENHVSPAYPEMLRQAGIGGRVLVRFVVDTSGRVEPATVSVISSTHDAFTRAVREVLPAMRFVPAEANGRRVRMLVEMPFDFSIESR